MTSSGLFLWWHTRQLVARSPFSTYFDWCLKCVNRTGPSFAPAVSRTTSFGPSSSFDGALVLAAGASADADPGGAVGAGVGVGVGAGVGTGFGVGAGAGVLEGGAVGWAP